MKVLFQTIAVEKAEVMTSGSGEEPSIFSEFRKIIGEGQGIDKLGRFEFYDECRKEGLKLTIATGEQRIYANILLTVGVVK